MSDIDLLPRADIPVLFNDFKTKADAVWSVVDSLVVTDISQKEAMALARKTRLTLREIRIAVEHKRVELGENHLKEIQKVNGAAKAIREFIEPLEARLLVQEEFAERAEAARIAELTRRRNAELKAIRPSGIFVSDLGAMPQSHYDEYLARLLHEKAELDAVNRLRIEAERKLAEAQAEAQRVAALTQATWELAQRVALEEKQRSDAEALRIEQAVRAEAAKLMLAQQVEAKAELDRANAIAEAKALEIRRLDEAAQSLRIIEQARLDEERAVREADLAEGKRIRDEQFAKLEAELAQANAAKQAEAKRVMELSIAPDVEKLWQFASLLRKIETPVMTTPAGISFAVCISGDIHHLATDIEVTCKSWGFTTK